MSEVVSYTIVDVARWLGIGVNLKVAAARLSLDGRFLELRVEDARNDEVQETTEETETCLDTLPAVPERKDGLYCIYGECRSTLLKGGGIMCSPACSFQSSVAPIPMVLG